MVEAIPETPELRYGILRCSGFPRVSSEKMASADDASKNLFLVQWEDRFMSVLDRKDVVHPNHTDIALYQEGNLIEAYFQKKIYRAVISEIHRKLTDYYL